MEQMKQYEIVYDKFNKRWTFKRQGLPGALQVAKTKPAIIERASTICTHESCILRIYNEDGSAEEERTFDL